MQLYIGIFVKTLTNQYHMIMKNFIIPVLFFLFGNSLSAAELILIKTSGFQETKTLFNNQDLRIHFYRDDFVIATAKQVSYNDYVVLDSNPWKENISYYIVYADNSVDKDSYLESIEEVADILYDKGEMMIVQTNEVKHGQLQPAKNDGMVRIFNIEAALPADFTYVFTKSDEPDPFILELMDEVKKENINFRVQHLENYGTRDAYSPISAFAQEWIEYKFLGWGLDVETMPFYMPQGAESDNVIATHTGTKYPDEYVVIGAHYDSISWEGDAPGADDNASGTAGVMEIARILSQYEFDRSIIFCAFSGEEYGLYGSAAYAFRSKMDNKNIIGYINMDMIGYLKPGNTTIMTSLIYPQSAKPLADFYTDVCAVYLPDFVVEPGTMTGGDSDHTSFNNNGYMGIFPFEDINNYSPYIHTVNDLVGPSYNNPEQAVIFTQAVLASVVKLANITEPPTYVYELNEDVSINVFPNPAKDIVSIHVNNDKNIVLQVYDVSGKNVLSQTISGKKEIDVSYFRKGVYIFNFEGENFNETHKVLIQ